MNSNLYVSKITINTYFKTMDVKLTLKLNQEVIEKAKQYAKDKDISLSKLIENMLARLTGDKDGFETTPFVDSLSGIINIDENDDYSDFLSEKYQ